MRSGEAIAHIVAGLEKRLGRFEEAGVVVAHVVDSRIDGARLHFVGCVGREQREESLRVVHGGIEPEVVIGRLKDHGHSLVDWTAEVVRSGRDDCAGFQRRAVAALRPAPTFPQAGKRERLLVGELEAIGQLLLAFLFPLVEAIGQNQAAAAGECGAKGWFFGQRFGAGVNQACGNFGILGPAWNEAPVEQGQLPFRANSRLPDDGDGLRRRYVVAGRNQNVRRQVEQKPLGEDGEGCSEVEAGAHGRARKENEQILCHYRRLV